MLQKLLLVAAIAALPACVSPPADVLGTESGLVVRSGTSFGMCMGHCITELTVQQEEVVLVERSRDPATHPTRTRTVRLSAEEWSSLAALADLDDFDSLPPTLGCPDCADGGAEWLEVEHQGERRRVTFEHGSDVPPVSRLLTRVREIRARFD